MAETELIEHLPFTTEQVIAARARIDLVLIAVDYPKEMFSPPGNPVGIDF